MKKLFGLLVAGMVLAACGAPEPAEAQSQTRVFSTCGSASWPVNGLGHNLSILPTGELCVNATVNASVGGFHWESSLTPLSVSTTTASSSSFTAGKTVVVHNVGTTNDIFCRLGPTATTAAMPIKPGSWMALTSTSETVVACITSSSTSTANIQVGTGLATGAGGGSSGGGGGGAVTIASGAVASGAYSSGSIASGAFASGSVASGAFASGSLASGAMVDLLTMRGPVAAGTAASNSLLAGGVYNSTPPTLTNGQQAALQFDANGNLKTYVNNTLAAVANNADDVAAGTGAASPVASYNYVWDGATWDRAKASALNPCETTAQSYATGVITSATTTRIIAPSASNKTYLCAFFMKASAADNVAMVEGTGGTCGTGTAALLGGTTTANGFVFGTAGDGVLLQAGGKVSIVQTAGTNVDTCLITSTTGPLIWSAKYVQAP